MTASDMRQPSKTLRFREDKEPSPCKSCPQVSQCLADNFVCKALAAWQAKYRDRPPLHVYVKAIT